MSRAAFKLFSEGKIGCLTLPNRLVRSATYEGASRSGVVSNDMIKLYEELVAGKVGMIITGLMLVAKSIKNSSTGYPTYKLRIIEGVEKLANVVHGAGTGCKIIGQIGQANFDAAASAYPTPFSNSKKRPITKEEIRLFEELCVASIIRLKDAGFDGVQLHAAHGYFLSSFLSPFMNSRTDEYGGSITNRARIIRKIVKEAREKVDDFPILIKMNCTDYVKGGTNINSFVDMAREMENIGITAIEISGGISECLVHTERELGFKPVFKSPEAHTGIFSIEKQCYHLPFAEKLNLSIPLILVGGNRNVERLEEVIQQGNVDFISMSRPLICEPDLPLRWFNNQGKSEAACIACNSCYFPIFGPDKSTPYDGPICVFKEDKQLYKRAQEWIVSWVGTHLISDER